MKPIYWWMAGAAVLLALIALIAAWPRFAVDMADQPSVGPQQALVQHPAGSIPIGRDEPAATPEDPAELVLARLEAGDIDNPVTPTGASLERGRSVYEVHCRLCHGVEGNGDGPVGRQFRPPPVDLASAYVQSQPDGQIFYTVSHGSLTMPFFRDAIPVEDRWHLVNYVKQMIGREYNERSSYHTNRD